MLETTKKVGELAQRDFLFGSFQFFQPFQAFHDWHVTISARDATKVRLAKLMRLFKLNRFLVILEEKLHLKPAMIRMVRLIINIVFLAHLLACMWHFIALPACGVETEACF
eukprot:Skav232259  [mRNA]  locus=scaffold273:237499:238833:+ [translate_table: standard]